MTISFGTSGWRAERSEFTKKRITAISVAITEILNENSNIIIGYDTRDRSEWIATHLANHLSDNTEVEISDRPVPTPSIAWYAGYNQYVDLAISATASHNPPEYNGIKILESNGADASEELTTQIEEYAKTHLESENNNPSAESEPETKCFVDEYKNYLHEQFHDRINENHTVLYDAVNGTGSNMFDELLEQLECQVETVNNRTNSGLMGLEPNPSKIDTEWMTKKIQDNEADIGFVSDCDADRLKVVTENGKIDGSDLLAVLYDHLSNRDQENRINAVRTVGAGSLIDRIAQSNNGEVFESPIGFKHTARLAEEKNAVISGDQTDGYCYPTHLLNKDGLYTAMIILEMIDTESITNRIERIKSEHGERYAGRASVDCADHNKETVMNQINSDGLPQLSEPTDVNRIDGVKLYYEDNWILIRPSGTEPKIRVYAESDDESTTQDLIQQAEEHINRITT